MALFAVGIGFLAHNLYQVQVVRSHNFSADLQRQSVRRVQVPGLRGRIYARDGSCLADNRASYCIAYYVEELRRRGKWTHTIDAVNDSIDRLSVVLGLPRQISYAAVTNHVMRSLPMPLLAWRDVDQTALARWSTTNFPGTDIYVQPERMYPQGALAGHIIGYVRRDKPRSLPGEKVHFYLPEMVGRDGIEAYDNSVLTGATGGRLLQVDARGYKTATWMDVPATRGRDVYLSLDLKLQRALENALGKVLEFTPETGDDGPPSAAAGVLIDPRNGEILAMASVPSFDPNEFVPVLHPAVWERLNNNPLSPMLNRALNGFYAPGSTFKTITALAALENGYQPDSIFDCEGVFRLGTMRLRCWGGIPHGPLTLESAIEKSCNAFFCSLGHQIGYEQIRKCAAQAGLGRKTGIDMPYEGAGSLPNPEWKKLHRKQSWTPGDTCQTAIGQGMLLATPLQMANACAAIANGGRLLKPHLHIQTLKAWNPDSCDVRTGTDIGWKRENVDLVRRGMRAVVDSGTGKRAAVRGLAVAAKTGTAEFDVRGKRRKNTWVIAFAPCDREASLALAIVVENGDSGGKTAAPLAHDIFAAAFGEAPAESEEEVEP